MNSDQFYNSAGFAETMNNVRLEQSKRVTNRLEQYENLRDWHLLEGNLAAAQAITADWLEEKSKEYVQ
jgi:hypothetical protein